MKCFSESLRSPDIKLAGLQVWLHGRQFPDSEDYWDSNWLNVTAHCGAKGASVWTGGPILHLSELTGWVNDCEDLVRTQSGEASLRGIEPELSIHLTAASLGHVTLTVEITPDHLTQHHRFEFELDQSYLPGLIREVRIALANYPLRGVEK